MKKSGRVPHYRLILIVREVAGSFSDIPSFQYSSFYHLKEFFLFHGHLPCLFFPSFMFVADQVEDAMDEEEDEHLHLTEIRTF